MHIYEGEGLAEVYEKVLYDLVNHPTYVTEPRGLKIKEMMNVSIVIKDPNLCLYKNSTRSSQIQYIVAESIWYFSGRSDLAFIQRYSKFWKDLTNADGTLNSAYGNLIFSKKNADGHSQWNWAYQSLINDKDSRQAIMHFNTPDHQYIGNKDFVCTLNGIFHIRDNKLNFTIEMRSNDVILGLATDVAFFCLLQQQMLSHLKEKYPTLELGTYTHIVNSLHLYERNFLLAETMLLNDFLDDEYPAKIGFNFIDHEGNKTTEFIKLHDSVWLNNSYDVQDELFQWIYNKAKK